MLARLTSLFPIVLAGGIGSVLTLALVSGNGPLAQPAAAQPSAPALPELTRPEPALPSPDALPPRSPQAAPPANRPGSTDDRPAPGVPQTRLGDVLGSAIDLSPAPLTADERIANAVYERCNGSVVNIAITSVRPGNRFTPPQAESGDSGSGIVLDREGHILTNNHVIETAQRIDVTLAGGRSFPGRLVGTDPLNDIAVLKIEADPSLLQPVRLVDSDSVVVGQRVFAIGNPFGLKRTLSTGIVASMDRALEVSGDWVISEVIQIDASINPGSSGGPLLDARGRLIGMNTAIAAETRQSAGIGFAIPTRLIVRTVPELIEHGRVVRGVIGIAQVAESPQGLRIHRLTPGGPAEEAGLRGPLVRVQRDGPYQRIQIDRFAADVIVAVDGQPIESTADFNGLLDGRKPGEVVEVTVLREGELERVRVTLGGERPGPRGQRDSTEL